LKKKGAIREIAGEVKRFDGDTCLHGHFICDKCSCIIDVFNIKKFKASHTKIPKVGSITNCQILYFGICEKCTIKRKRNTKKK